MKSTFTSSVIVSLVLAEILSLNSFSIAKEKTYLPSTENFSNPERGFYKDGTPSTSSMIDNRKNSGITLIRRYYRMSSYRTVAVLPASFLDNLTKEFKYVRDAGCKIIPRFNYSNSESEPDASREIILGHISQLKPILMANADIIAFMEAGFIGAWGEWHHSSNLLDNREAKDKLGKDNTQPGAEILSKLLDALPSDRMVALRYNHYKRSIFNTDLPLTETDAYKGTPRSRTGAHNDCFLASKDDNGTYAWATSAADLSAVVEKEKTYLNLDNRFVPQGGETCATSAYSGCDSALVNLKRMRWDAINSGFNGSVLSGWTSGKCMETIKTHLGYRFQLNKATLQDSAKPGNTWSMSFSITNVGWGKAYNPRAVEIVLRQVNGNAKYRFPVNVDPRFWLTDIPVTVNVNAGIPKTMPEGEYKAFLNLPDPAKTLRDRAEYSIRLGNQSLWEDSTGFNYLDANVFIKATAREQPLSAGTFFTPWGDGPPPVSLVNRKPAASRIMSARFPLSLFPSEQGVVDIMGRIHPETSTRRNGQK